MSAWWLRGFDVVFEGKDVLAYRRED